MAGANLTIVSSNSKAVHTDSFDVSKLLMLFAVNFHYYTPGSTPSCDVCDIHGITSQSKNWDETDSAVFQPGARGTTRGTVSPNITAL